MFSSIRLAMWLCVMSFAQIGFGFSVTNVSPKGDVKKVRQVRLQFDQPMVSFGDPNTPDPAKMTCEGLRKDITGSSRWLAEKEWVYEFSEELHAGVRCVVQLRADLKDLKQTSLSGPNSYTFSTGGPQISSIQPYPESQMDSEAAVMVVLDADVDRASVLQHAFFVSSSTGEKIGVRIADEKTAKEVIKNQYFYGDDKKKTKLVLLSQRSFPAGTKLKFIWEKGIRTKNGVLSTVTQSYQYRIRENMSVKFSCQRESAKENCSPLLGISVEFTNDVARDQLRRIVVKDQNGKVYVSKASENESASYLTFDPPFSPLGSVTIEVPRDFKDVDGRPLVNANKFPLTVKFADYPPLAKFSARFGLVEASEPLLPIAVRKLDADVTVKLAGIMKANGVKPDKFLGFEWNNGKTAKVENPKDVIYWLKRLENIDREFSLFDRDERLNKDEKKPPMSPGAAPNQVMTMPIKVPIPKDGDTQVVGIPLGNKGFHVVEIESPILAKALIGEHASFYIPAGALVTNLAVHFKWGAERSLAWVTTLDKAETVSKALVQVFDCNGSEVTSGQTNSDGVVTFDKAFPKAVVERCSGPGYNYQQGYFVFASKGDDFTFTHTSWNKGIESWRYSVPTNWSGNPQYSAHSVLDRTLLRAGETLHMKHVYRRNTQHGFAMVDKDSMPKQVEIFFNGNSYWKSDLSWRSDGTAESEWKIPPSAKLGVYHIELSGAPKAAGEYGEPMISTSSFEVQEFKVPLMKTTLKVPTDPLVAPEKMNVPVHIQYLAGGAAGNLPVKVRGLSSAKESLRFPDLKNFDFRYSQVKTGTHKRNNRVEEFDDSDGALDSNDDESRQVNPKGAKPKVVDLILDSAGNADANFTGLPQNQLYDFAVEAEYRDPNGETQISRQSVQVFPSERLVGFDQTRWVNLKNDLQIKMMAVDTKGKPVSGALVEVQLFSKKSSSHRKRLIGGFYSYENYEEIKSIDPEFCRAKSDANGLVVCRGKTTESGEILAQAIVKDDKGHFYYGYSSLWVQGDEDWWFSQDAGDRIDLIPEKQEYNPGDLAVFQVRSPFRDATALVTIEREGVIDFFVTDISGKNPTIAVPIKGGYGPNVFVSALLVRGRVADGKATALVDLGKPAFKMGLTGVRVGWEAHRLKVSVHADRQVYKIREKAKVKIKISPDGDGESFKGGTVLIAAVDEGLLQLMPNRTWDLLSEMMGERQYAVATSTAQLQVIGKRHFGLKAIASGGGGGNGAPRKLFDTLLLWKDQIEVGKSGTATVEIPLNDSLTSFRIVAIAMGGTGRFGTGEASIRSSQDVMVFSSLPAVVREGDQFKGAINLRNATDSSFDLSVTAKVKAVTEQGSIDLPGLEPKEIRLDKNQSTDVSFPIVVPNDAKELVWSIETKTKSKDKVLDRIESKQVVKPALPIHVLQTTLMRAAPNMSLAVERPKNALQDRGGFRVELSSSLVSQLSNSQEHMRDYPYSCLEQKVSVAVSLNDQTRWSRVADSLANYLDGNGLVKYFPDERWGYDVLTSYLLSVSARNRFEISPQVKARMVDGLNAWLKGKVSHPEIWSRPDRPLRQVSAVLAISLAANGSFNAKLVDDFIDPQPQLWPTSTLVEWFELLLREPSIKDRDAKLKLADAQIRTRLHAEGNAVSFADVERDAVFWLMSSNDAALARLISILSAYENATSLKDDLPRLVQGLFMRQKSGHWDLTTANAWAAVGLREFGAKFEKDPVAGETLMALDGDRATWAWKNADDGSHLERPMDVARNPAQHDFAMKGPKGTVVVEHKGSGAPWAMISSRFAIPITSPIKNGMSLERKIVAVEQKTPGKWSTGDLVRVDFTMNSTAAQVWVVLNDPIPAGATIIGSAGSKSGIVGVNDRKPTDISPTFVERGFEGLRAYYSTVGNKPWTYSYTFRLNQDGRFALPPSRLEAMYSPAMFAEVPTEIWNVE